MCSRAYCWRTSVWEDIWPQIHIQGCKTTNLGVLMGGGEWHVLKGSLMGEELRKSTLQAFSSSVLWEASWLCWVAAVTSQIPWFCNYSLLPSPCTRQGSCNAERGREQSRQCWAVHVMWPQFKPPRAEQGSLCRLTFPQSLLSPFGKNKLARPVPRSQRKNRSLFWRV